MVCGQRGQTSVSRRPCRGIERGVIGAIDVEEEEVDDGVEEVDEDGVSSGVGRAERSGGLIFLRLGARVGRGGVTGIP